VNGIFWPREADGLCVRGVVVMMQSVSAEYAGL